MEKIEQRLTIARLFKDLKKEYPMDILVYTKDEWKKLKNAGNSFIKEIESTGVKEHRMKNTASEWLDFANNDFQAAKKLSEDEHLTKIVLFHCQQTIEKALKALLSEKTDSVPRIHSVYTLFEKLPAEIKRELNI